MLLVFHIVLCVLLIFVILLQAGKSGGSISPLGGASQSLFGATGAGNFLTRGTTLIAILFFITSLTLTIATSREASESIVKEDTSSPVETTETQESSPVDEATTTEPIDSSYTEPEESTEE